MKFSLNFCGQRCSYLSVIGSSLLSLLITTGCSGLGLPSADGSDGHVRSVASQQLRVTAARHDGKDQGPKVSDGRAEDDIGLSEASVTTARCRHSDRRFNCVKVVSVYDGDTIFVDVPGVHPLFGKRMGVRIYGIDTPERSGQAPCEKAKALEAKNVVESLVSSAKRIDLVELQRDKYFRILAKVLVDGRSVADELLSRKLAYPYFGDTKERRGWCE